MNQLTNEEIAKVFAMYWGCSVEGTDMRTDDIWKGKFRCLHREYVVIMSEHFTNPDFDMACTYAECNLLLTPLANITDEDAVVGLKLAGLSFKGNNAETCSQRLVYELKARPQFFTKELFQYLISKGYAVPLFFTPGHWANGKTAIELGIALPSISVNQ